jgi:hypothetical protein
MMTFDEPPLERAYPYRTGWKVIGCLGLLSAAFGAAGAALMPVCCEKWRNGNVAFGVLAVLGTPCTMLAILLTFVAFLSAVREAVRPPLLRLTPTALLLPEGARGHAPGKDEPADTEPAEPHAHPEEIPFGAIRWVRREAGGAPGNDRLLIVHDLGPVTLELQQCMMHAADFDELETILRAAVPTAFTALPVPPSPPPTDAA